jgi:hypothetical protein
LVCLDFDLFSQLELRLLAQICFKERIKIGQSAACIDIKQGELKAPGV